MIKIQLKFSGKILNTYTLDKQIIDIGRNPGNDIQIDNLAVSDRHAQIVKDNDKYWIEDLNSTNGICLDDKRVKKIELKDNQQITIAKHTLTVNMMPDVDTCPDVMKTIKFDAEDY